MVSQLGSKWSKGNPGYLNLVPHLSLLPAKHSISINRGTWSKIPDVGGVSFPEGGGVNFSDQKGVTS